MHHQIRKIAFAVGLTLVASVAGAAEAEVFGRIDTGLLYTANTGDTKDTLKMSSGYSSGSRWGISVSEKLNDDWSVKAHLESGFESDTGELKFNRLFSRQSTISIKNKSFGELAFGRSGKPLSGSDQFTRIRSFLPFGVTHGDAGLLFYGKGGRIDNGIFYQSPTFAGVTVLLAGSFQTSGQEKEEWTENTRFWGGSVDWKYGNFGLMIGAEQTVLGPDKKEENGDKNPTTLYLGTSYDFGFMKLMAGYQRGWDLDRIGCFDEVKWGTKTSQIEAFDANSYILGATIPAWGGTIRLSGLYSEGTNSKPLYTRSNNKKNPVAVGPDAGYWSVAVGYSYPFSKRTNIYGVISHLEGLDGLDADDKNVQAVNDDGSMSRTQIAIGLVHKF